MSAQTDWMAMIPHAGAMRLIDRVVSWSATTIHAVGERHTLDDHPLRDGATLHTVHLAEYGAQATAVHGALLAAPNGESGVRGGRLVSLRDVQLTCAYVDLSQGPLNIHAECLFANQEGSQYSFIVEQQGQSLMSGRVAVMFADA